MVAILFLIWLAAWIDFKTHRIPNPLCVTGAILGFILQTWTHGPIGLWYAFAGLALWMALMLPGYLMRLTGAGDVKLMGALGALLGVEATIPVFLATFIAGGLVGSIYAFIAWSKQGATSPIARYKDMFQWFWMTGRLSYKPPAPEEAMAQRFPFGIAIALGTSFILLEPLF
jgi:prepilin peptidase CpaA